MIVATKDSSQQSRELADFVCDGRGDQEEIHRAIEALPVAGGTINLMEGTYDIRKVEGSLGGITSDRSPTGVAGTRQVVV